MRCLRPVWWRHVLACPGGWLVVLAIAQGCASRVDPTEVGQELALASPPAGCARTMCDYLYEGCQDPCAQCWGSCAGEVDRVSVIACAHACEGVCALAGDAGAASASCSDERERCRATFRNGICVDHLGDVMPDSERPCSPEMSRARCACEGDAPCMDALSKLNAHCEKCNAGWQVECLATVCKNEDQALFACLDAHRCATVSACGESCAEPYGVLADCAKRAELDERDVGGCYSGARACSDDPVCAR